jgi:thioester reductase-like protein
MKILIIGGTGFIGQRLVRKLHQQGEKIFLLSRPSSLEKAKSLFKDLSDITFIRGDIQNTDLLTDVSQADNIGEQIDCIIHMAAIYELDVSATEAHLQNVIGTQNVLKFISRCKGLKYFHYFSTYAVNQVIKGKVFESDLISENTVFYDEYARSKNHAEHLVRKLAPKSIHTIIHRPGIVVGDGQTGVRDKDNGPYYFFNFIRQIKKLGKLSEKLKYLPLPVQKNSLMPVIPVDTLVDWTSLIIQYPKERTLSCYHLVPRGEIKTKEFLQLSIELMNSPLKIISSPITGFFSPLFKVLQLPEQLVFYMRQEATLDRGQLNQDYPDLKEPDYNNYLPILIKEFEKGR